MASDTKATARYVPSPDCARCAAGYCRTHHALTRAVQVAVVLVALVACSMKPAAVEQAIAACEARGGRVVLQQARYGAVRRVDCWGARAAP
jgi:hypothetical protein